MASEIKNIIREDLVRNYGLFDLIIPFFFIYIIVYTILSFISMPKIESAGDKDKEKFNRIVAFAFSILAVVPHIIFGQSVTAGGAMSSFVNIPGVGQIPDIVVILNRLAPQIALLLAMVIFAIMALQAASTGRTSGTLDNLMGSNYFALVILLVCVFIFLTSTGIIERTFSYYLNTYLLSTIVIGFIGYILYLIIFSD